MLLSFSMEATILDFQYLDYRWFKSNEHAFHCRTFLTSQNKFFLKLNRNKMCRKLTKKQIAQIIKNQPRVVLERIDFSKAQQEVKEVKTRRTTHKIKKETLFNQDQPNSTKKPVKAVANRNAREIVRTTNIFRENNIVLVKWPYSPDWPAVVQSIKGNSIHVQFFGDGG